MSNQLIPTKANRQISEKIQPKSISQSHQQSRDANFQKFMNYSTSVSEPFSDDINSVGNERGDIQSTRAKGVPQTQDLRTAFTKDQANMQQYKQSESAVPTNSVVMNVDHPKIDMSNKQHFQHNNSPKQIQESRGRQLQLGPSENQKEAETQERPRKPSPKNEQQQLAVERQIKYLGLVIEKDEEHRYKLLRKNSENSMKKSYYENYSEVPEDDIQRQYYPVREKYIMIVKNSRRQFIESLERRGHHNMKQTTRNLKEIRKVLKTAKKQNKL